MLKEAIVVKKRSKLFNTIHRAFKYSSEGEVWFYSKKTKQRLGEHTTRCFKHAHYLFARELKRNNIKDWVYWRIELVGRPTVGQFQSKQVEFQFVKREPSPEELEQ